jgi:hypothetical protein
MIAAAEIVTNDDDGGRRCGGMYAGGFVIEELGVVTDGEA